MKQIHPIAMLLTLFIAASSCGSGKAKPDAAGQSAGDASTAANTASPATVTADDAKDGVVNFKVNDTSARTKKAPKDTDAHLGMYTEATKHFGLGLQGDVPNRPHRGWLEITITNNQFKFEPGTYTLGKDVYARFTRYETENAGGATDFIAYDGEKDKGTAFTLTITKVEKVPNDIGGTEHRISGTFSAKMFNKIYEMKRTSTPQELNITEGSFENIRVVGGPK
jgi:hypothetical protein